MGILLVKCLATGKNFSTGIRAARAVGGADAERPPLKRLLPMFWRGNVVMITALDRLSCDTYHFPQQIHAAPRPRS